MTARGEALAAAPLRYRGAGSKVAGRIDPARPSRSGRPPEIPGDQFAGAVYLIDRHRRGGALASSQARAARRRSRCCPRLLPQRVPTPFAEVGARNGRSSPGPPRFVAASPSIIILSDGAPCRYARERLKAFVEEGGMLIRFAARSTGRRSAPAAPLREGRTVVGGPMTWTSPPKSLPRSSSDFAVQWGLRSGRCDCLRQFLSDPSAVPRDARSWSRLMDGTPLVTACEARSRRSSTFSTLPSIRIGLTFQYRRSLVEMMQKDSSVPWSWRARR